MDVKFFIFLNFVCLLDLYFNSFVEGDVFYGLCADQECSSPISRGHTILRYNSPDDTKISVEANEEVQIYVKEYGPKRDLWGVIVRGNKGYISKNFIRETNLFAKELVPAFFDFKTLILRPDSYTVSNHLHASSRPYQSDVMSETLQHTPDYNLLSSAPSHFQQQNNFVDLASQQQNNFPDIVSQQQQGLMNSAPNVFQQQQGLMNSAPNAFQQQQGLMNSAPNTFQHQQGSMNSVPNTFQQQQDFTSSAPNTFQQQQGIMNSAPNAFQQQQDLTNSVPSSIQQDWNSAGDNQVHNPAFSANPSSSFEVQAQLNPPSHFSVVPEHSSHFPMHSENIMNYEMTGMQSQEILPSSANAPGMRFPSHQHSQVDPVMTSLYENSVNSAPTSSDHGHFNPSTASTSQNFHSPDQIIPNEQLHNIESPHAQKTRLSSYSNDYVDEDYEKTFAMLSSMGVESSDMYANQEVPVNPSSQQNTERNFDFISAESISSQSQHSSIETSDTIFHSSIDPTSHLKENKIGNSDNPKMFSDSVLAADFKNLPFENLNSIPQEKPAMDLKNEDNSKEEKEESEMLSDESIDDLDEDEDYENDSSDDDDEKNIDDIENLLNEKSQSSSQMISQSSENMLDVPSSLKDSLYDTSTVNMPSKDHSSVIQKDHSHVLSSKISPDISTVSEETEFFPGTPSLLQSSMAESTTVGKTESVNDFIQNNLDATISLNTIDPFVSNIEVSQEKQVDVQNIIPQDLSENFDRNNHDALTTESVSAKEHTVPKISDFFMENEKTEVKQILSPMDIDGFGEDLATYQGRNLKGEYVTTDDPLSESEGNDENNTQSESDSYSSNGNWLDALRSAMDSIISWIPEPLYSALIELRQKGISPRLPVFTLVCGLTCVCLIVPLYYIKERSKENKLTAVLTEVEEQVYRYSAENIALEDKLETAETKVVNLQTCLAEEKSLSESLRTEFENKTEELENAKAELESCFESIDALKEKENEYLTLINVYEKEKEYYAEHKESLDKILKEQENSIETLTCQLQESENKIQDLEKEKEQLLLMKVDYEDKLALFDRNCNQLLQEAEVWNMRVKELTENVDSEVAIKEELKASLKSKDEEIESLKELVDTFKIFDEIEDPEEQVKTKEEKLQSLLSSIMIINQLKKEEQKSKVLDEQLQEEKSKILDIEVELLDAKSEIDKLKLNYNQALQDKAEAQTKLEVLTNYFKDKEIQLQRQLGAQEADRQKKEDDVNSAGRRIMLIEQENASYKSQVASMKQEMEETERTLRSQIAAQEKKAHENWIAARAAERNLENMKQEVTQLRQRLTLLEREQENWANASREDIIRPVPKRIPGVNDESGNQETSERGMFHPPHLHDRLHLMPPMIPMMLPPDRPLPPIPPPPMPPMFLPPPPPHLDRDFRPMISQPWHIPPDHRTTPPEFVGGRESTPPRGRPTTIDGDIAPNTSSPMTTDNRDSRNSTPPHLLPDFHDVPPQSGRPYFPPPVGRSRFPMHPPYRRDGGPDPRRLDNHSESSSRGPPQPPASEQWQHSRV